MSLDWRSVFVGFLFGTLWIPVGLFVYSEIIDRRWRRK